MMEQHHTHTCSGHMHVAIATIEHALSPSWAYTVVFSSLNEAESAIAALLLTDPHVICAYGGEMVVSMN